MERGGRHFLTDSFASFSRKTALPQSKMVAINFRYDMPSIVKPAKWKGLALLILGQRNL